MGASQPLEKAIIGIKTPATSISLRAYQKTTDWRKMGRGDESGWSGISPHRFM
jgi:hypothetical protein